MITNLVVNGCSFTEGSSWAKTVAIELTPNHYQNLARGGAGNFYISNSTINYLSLANLDPAETMVIIMWSGSGRKDLRISGEWYYHLKKQKYLTHAMHKPGAYVSSSFDESEYYLFSGGVSNSWMSNSDTKKVFEWAYKLSDPMSLCKDTLMNIVNLENYLKVHNYQYRFLSYFNQWSDITDHSSLSGDYSIGHFLKDITMYKNYSFDNWIFIDQERNCLGEFASGLNKLHNHHPTLLAHRLFAEQFIIPALPVIQQIHM